MSVRGGFVLQDEGEHRVEAGLWSLGVTPLGADLSATGVDRLAGGVTPLGVRPLGARLQFALAPIKKQVF